MEGAIPDKLGINVKSSGSHDEDSLRICDFISIDPKVISRLNDLPTYLRLRDVGMQGMEELVDVTQRQPEFSWLSVSQLLKK
jgi:hypothetical protein